MGRFVRVLERGEADFETRDERSQRLESTGLEGVPTNLLLDFLPGRDGGGDALILSAGLEERLRLPFEGGLQGEAVIDLRATSDAAGRRLTGSAVIMEAGIAFGHGREPVMEQEVRAEFDAACVGTSWTVTGASLKCRTADLS